MAFINQAVTVLQTLVIALGAGLAVWGVVNLMEGYGNDNPGAKSQGIKQLMAGGGVVPVSYTHLDVYKRQVHQCCNYESGNCLALDDGEECICVQSISYSLLCNWFRAAVLPLDDPLATALLYRKEHKQCAVCGHPFLPGSNRAKYCKSCATIVHRRQKTASDRKRRAACGQLGMKKP